MRLQFPLSKVVISPASHIQISRHAQQFKNRYAIGQLYGALYDDEAHITNILPYPDAQNMSTPEELESMQIRHKDMLNKFNLDNSNIGWYLISYKQSVWEQLQNVQYYEKYLNTSFLLVYDYEARLFGKNPYRAYRLTDQFVGKQQFELKELARNQIQNPFIEIPAQVRKDQIFQSLMLLNRKSFLQQFKKLKNYSQPKQTLSSTIQTYLQTLHEQSQVNRNNQQKSQNLKKQQKNVTFNEYCENMGLLLKAQNQQKKLRRYEQNIKNAQKILREL